MSRAAKPLMLLLACAAALGAGVGTTLSAFSEEATNSGNSFEAASCSTPGSQTITASRDAWIDQASPSANKGTDSVLKVTSKSGNANTRALVQYDLPSVPSGCSVTSAKLRLYNNSPVSGRTLEALQNGASWTENGVTWSNQPATTGSAATATTTSTAGFMEWAVTSQVQGMYSGSNYGFKVRDAAEDSAAGPEQPFRSREAGSTPPELVVTYG